MSWKWGAGLDLKPGFLYGLPRFPLKGSCKEGALLTGIMRHLRVRYYGLEFEL